MFPVPTSKLKWNIMITNCQPCYSQRVYIDTCRIHNTSLMCNESLRNYKPQEVLHRGVASDQGEQDLTLVANPHTYLGGVSH